MPGSLTDPPPLKPRAAIASSDGKPSRRGNADDADLETSLPVLVDDRNDPAEDIGIVAAALTSSTAVSVFSSATFHLIAWGLAIVLCQLFGLDWLQMMDVNQPPLQAALGDQDIPDDAAKFEFAADISTELETPSSSLEQLAQQLQKSDAAWLKSTTDDIWNNVPAGDSTDPNDTGTGVLLKVPASGLAVTKGSFTAFTIPAQPKPREAYAIVIEVRLTDNVRKYRVSDLSGEVRGSDRYVQKLPFDSRAPMASGYPAEDKKIKPLTTSTILNVVDNRVQIIVKVPGAARLVRDEIRIRSKKLREEQEITLIFGKPAEETPEQKPPEKKDAD